MLTQLKLTCYSKISISSKNIILIIFWIVIIQLLYIRNLKLSYINLYRLLYIDYKPIQTC